MRRRDFAVLFALIVAIIALAAFAPATLLDRQLAAATQEKLRLSDAQGTIWRGRGAIGDARGTWRVPVAWRLAPLGLARGTLALTFEPLPDGSGPRGEVTLREGAFDVRGVSLALPAAGLANAIGEGIALAAGGEIMLDAPMLRYAARSGDGAVAARWDRARLAWNGATLDLGTIAGRLVPRGEQWLVTLSNSGGAARLSGEITATTEGASLRGTIAPGPETPPEIARTLAALGTPDASGAVQIQARVGAR